MSKEDILKLKRFLELVQKMMVEVLRYGLSVG